MTLFDMPIFLCHHFICSVESREALMLWCCTFHNEVNVMIGKPEFVCTTEELDIRWKDGREECWEERDDSGSSGGGE